MASGNTFKSLAANGEEQLLSAVSSFTGNANEIVATDGSGQIDSSILSNAVLTTTNQTVNGEKTFTSPFFIRTVNAAARGLNLNTDASGSSWDIYAGSAANFDNWLRFSNSASANPNEAVLTNDGAFRVLNGSAGAPGHAFINGSNYGISLQGTNDILALSAAGTNQITFNGSTGEIVIPSFGEGVLVSSSTGVITSQDPLSLVDKQFDQSLAVQNMTFANGGGTGTAYQTINNSSITTLNTVTTNYELTANFSIQVTNNNNRTLQYAVFINAVETVTFNPARFDQANDVKSVTIRWNLALPVGAVVDWRVRNINQSSDVEIDRRNFTIEEF